MTKLHLLDTRGHTDYDVAEHKNPDASPCIGLQTAETAGNMSDVDSLVCDESDATRQSVAPLDGGLRRSARLQQLLVPKPDKEIEAPRTSCFASHRFESFPKITYLITNSRNITIDR